MQPNISVITVVRNAAGTILQTLQSVASQDYKNVEHWVLDGLSTDGTIEIIQKFAKEYPHVKWLSGADQGMYDALNKGIQLARGEMIGFLHADDFYANKQVLSQVIACFDDRFDAVYSDLVYVNARDTNKIIRFWQSKLFQAGDFAKGWHPPHPTLFIRKTIYEQLGAFDTRLPIGNDVELMMRYFEKHAIKAHYEPKIWVKMRMGGISNRSVSNIVRQNRVIREAFRQNNLPFSWVRFCIYKAISRITQFLSRPKGIPHAP